MVNKDNQIVCDLTKVIIDDGVTLYPGYVEVKDGMMVRYDSQDPNNELVQYKPWILHNRSEFKHIAYSKPCKDEKLQGKHFMSVKAMNKYLTEYK